jgi:PKD repeat protein
VIALSSLFCATAQRTCGTMDVHNRLMQNDPQYAAARAAMERFTQQYIASGMNLNRRSVITIPVVVHVVYSDAAGNLSDAQVQSQIARLNLDYHKLNPDTALVPSVWTSLIADCNIQFCLAQRDPSGLPTNGIVRTSTTVTSFIDNDNVKYTAQGGDDAWPASSYLNIWACDLGGGLLGYSQFPGGPAATDGCVILNTAFGDNTGTVQAPYDRGRTVTHEVGHWLNLFHTWGDDGGSCSGSDQVNDTPNSADATYGAPAFPLLDNCATASPGVMFMNYMDYTDDAAMYMFTVGQDARIQANFANGGGHAALLNSLGCVSPGGGPYANFTADYLNICAGEQVQFTDMSYDTPTVWHWVFTGGTPDTSNQQNPLVTYSTPGVYPVSLTVTKDTSSNTKTINSYINVKGTSYLPLAEDFESGVFPPAGWSLVNPDNQTAWAQSSTAGGFGQSSSSAYLDNYTQANIRNQLDYLYSPVLDFTQGITADSKLKFDYAYAQKRSTSRDSLIIRYSIDCGSTWTTVWSNGNAGMATTTTLYGNSVYTPAAGEWVRDSSILLSQLAGATGVQFQFINKSYHGNAVYLDNINIDAPPHIFAAVNDIDASMKVSVVPNPAVDRCTVFLNMTDAHQVDIALYDMIGQQVWSRDLGVVRNSSEVVSLSGLSSGVYVVKVKAGDKSYTTRLVKE